MKQFTKKIERVLDRHSPLGNAIKEDVAKDINEEIIASGLLEIIEKLDELGNRLSVCEKKAGIILKERILNEMTT